jgi:hypothetical protein
LVEKVSALSTFAMVEIALGAASTVFGAGLALVLLIHEIALLAEGTERLFVECQIAD